MTCIIKRLFIIILQKKITIDYRQENIYHHIIIKRRKYCNSKNTLLQSTNKLFAENCWLVNTKRACIVASINAAHISFGITSSRGQVRHEIVLNFISLCKAVTPAPSGLPFADKVKLVY